MSKPTPHNYDSRIDTVLDFWFGDQSEGFPIEDKNYLWWSANPEVDEEIRQKFGELINLAGNGKLSSWHETVKGNLALIIVLDQLTRNVYRGTARAFEYDHITLEITKEGISKGIDLQLTVSECLAFYRTLQHSENIDDQNLCIELIEQMLQKSPEAIRSRIQEVLKFAIVHRDIVAKFGRFPHRNRALGRESTPFELEYLEAGGKRFGQ